MDIHHSDYDETLHRFAAHVPMLATQGRHEAAPETEHRVRHEMVATAAYYRAERRGFAPGHELDDWLAAETEIETRLRENAWGASEHGVAATAL